MLNWITQKLFFADAMVKTRKTAETRMVQAPDAQEALQTLDTAYVFVTELIAAQSTTIAKLQKELDAAKAGEASSSKVKRKREEPAPEAEEEKKEEKKEWVTPEEEKKEEKKAWVTPEEEKKEEEIKLFEVDTKGVPQPAPSETSEYIDLRDGDDLPQPPRKRGRYDDSSGEIWTCFRCLTRCGKLSKQCRVPISELSHPALIGSWIRIAHKGRPDDRNEFPALTAEIRVRGLIEPANRKAGEAMLRDLNTSMSLGTPIPKEYVRMPQVEIHEVTVPEGTSTAPNTPVAPPADPGPPTPMGSTGPGPVLRESEEEYASRVKTVLLALEASGVTESLKAQIVSQLVRK